MLRQYKKLREWVKSPLTQKSVTETGAPVAQQSNVIDFSATIPANKFAHKPIKYYETATGNYHLPDDAPNDVIVHYMKTGEIFEPEIIAVAQEFIQPGTTVLDIGANLGQMSVLFSKMAGPQGQVFAFEADDFIFHLLQKNIKANHCENIRAFFGAVYDKSKTEVYYPEQTFERFSAYGSYGIDPNAHAGRKLIPFAIDDLNIQSPISFMKVDIQGSDLFALRGAVETIAKHQMPIIFEFEQQFQDEFNTTFQDYIDFIQSINYKVLKVVNNINYLIVPKNKTTVALSPDDYRLQTTRAPFQQQMCKLLKSRAEVEECTHYLHSNGYISHHLSCKDWDLAHIIADIHDGNFLDMGSSDSYILSNVSLKRTKGEKYGIDLAKPDVPLSNVHYIEGNLMQTGLPTNHFKYITCLSVLEHQIDFDKFALEVNRLLQSGGRLYVTFDYQEPRVNPGIKLYDLNWQPLDKQMLSKFIETCRKHQLNLIQDFDWSQGDAVLQWGYYSPHPSTAYTFGLAVFEKS